MDESVKSSDKTWSTGEGNGKSLKYSCHKNSMNIMKRQKKKKKTLEDELPQVRKYPIHYSGRAEGNKLHRE